MYKSFAKILLNNEKICEILKNYDIITEVPMYKKKKLKRGYNQSTLIAKEIAKTQNNLNYEGVIEKIKDNKMQSKLNRKERIENVKNAYKTREKEIIFDKNIVLFDDVYTTRCNSK